MGVDGKSCVAIRFFDQCDPTVSGWDTTQFQVCLFSSSVSLNAIPKVGSADSDGSTLSFVGKGKMPIVSIRSVKNLKKYVNNIPPANYAWAIYGMLSVSTSGNYLVCTTSSDG